MFGSTLPDAVLPAADAFRSGLAPLIALTGGPNRREPAHVESDVHAQLLRSLGIAPGQMIVERRSRTSVENVAFARPLIEERLSSVRTVVAVVFPVKCFCSRSCRRRKLKFAVQVHVRRRVRRGRRRPRAPQRADGRADAGKQKPSATRSDFLRLLAGSGSAEMRTRESVAIRRLPPQQGVNACNRVNFAEVS
ncbi:YdcF family protein [Winogradskya humida]|uniref:YdcF family protein n=1 Tax=Winogradskya humida TaxID=113566 RepID=UPI00194149E1